MNEEKVFVAVHGVGDQFSYETIQSVARQVYKYWNFSGALPLGWLYGEIKIDPQDPACEGRLLYKNVCQRGKPAPCTLCKEPHHPEFGCVSFAEVHWAGIARKIADEGHTLEETKGWVKTIVERLRAKNLELSQDGTLSRDAFRNVKDVLVEMLMAVRIIERLVGWLEKHTPLRFHLKNVLDQYVCDVQVVTEYHQFREEILGEFQRVMGKIHQKNPAARIYVIAHSEGTVVAFLSLLRALSHPNDSAYDWVDNVQGLMTLGSPIDKHLILWPELWSEFEVPSSVVSPKWRKLADKGKGRGETGTERLIPWYNYYDYGDPVGFDLDTARHWMQTKGENPPFDFQEEYDIGFSRYVFPGKAHTDYWRDRRVFGHFFENVVRKEELAKIGRTPAGAPLSIMTVRLLSGILPYLAVTAICGAGVYLLYKATAVATGHKIEGLPWEVLCLAAALAAVTAAARLPRLARATWALPTSIALAALGTGFAYLAGARLGGPAEETLPVTAAIIAVCGWFSFRLAPTSSIIPMLAIGAGGASTLIYRILSGEDSEAWPVVVAGIGFMYLWWVAALLFDLSVIWHRYICSNTGMDKIEFLATSRSRNTSKKTKCERLRGEPKIQPF